MVNVSVIIPSRNEQLYLEKTVRNVLENAGGEIEIIVVLDGWLPSPQIEIPNCDGEVVWIHHEKAQGQRASINEAARIAKGEYVMKLDAHCAVGKDFDVILSRDCEYDMTMIPAMFNLDVETWKPKYFDDWDKAVRKGKLNPYMHIGWKSGHLRACYYGGDLRREIYEKGKDKPVDETMCCMGPAFFMSKERFWELDGCDEGHGQWGQQGVEVACKAWLSGGRLMTNKNTWFAHFFRGGAVPEGHKSGFPYRISQKAIDRARIYSEKLWLENKWPKQTKTLQWLVSKFNPPTWDKYRSETPEMEDALLRAEADVNATFYRHIHRGNNHPQWRGVPVLKMPSDMSIYAEVIHETKPEIIVEIGTKFGGSALFFQDLLDLNGGGKVITIDIKEQVENKDPRIEYVLGNSISKDVVRHIKRSTRRKRTMLVIDGNHHRGQVIRELRRYRGIVTPGCYAVVEDCYIDRGKYGPWYAKEQFLKENDIFEQTDRHKKFVIGVCREGWLKRI